MYRTSDLAEIVSDPSPITLKYLRIWFTGAGAYGKGLKKLGWPINPLNKSLLVWDEKNGLRVDVSVEECTMYGRTIFGYVKRGKSVEPHIDLKKISIPALVSTIKIVWTQSMLLANNQSTYDRAKSYVENIPLAPPDNLQRIETDLENIVWPNLVAVDYIGEYVLSILTRGMSSEQEMEIIGRIHKKVRSIDWYTHSMLAWSDYKDGKLAENDLLHKYGYAAGDAYELTKPRYYELLKKPRPPTGACTLLNMKVIALEDLAVGMHYLRSEVKRRSLIWIAALREKLMETKKIY